MPRFTCIDEDVLGCDLSSLQSYQELDSQDLRPQKRQKVESDAKTTNIVESCATSFITLWDVEVLVPTDSLEVDLAPYDGLSSQDFYARSSNTRVGPKQVVLHTSLRLPRDPSFLTLHLHTGRDDSYGITDCLLALATEPSSVHTRLQQVYGDTRISRQLYIRDTQVVFQFKAEVRPLHEWSLQSMKLANDKTFRFLINAQYPDETRDRATVSAFYAAIQPPPTTSKAWTYVRELKTELMQYQKNAVDWMLDRESASEEQPNLWTSYVQSTDDVVFLQKPLGLISRDEHIVSKRKDKLLGGLLSDEMGLGKTLEVITTIIKNRRRIFSDEATFDTLTGNELRPIATTLIVTPSTIVEQWLDEVEKHSDLKAYNYPGIRHIDASAELDLSQYDVVVTSYPILAQEVHHTAAAVNKKTLRNAPLYENKKSPLVKYEFWRVIFDEAQQVQSGATAAAQVAGRIPRVLAWAVTGTPVSRSCEDLYGLLHFLRIDPIYSNPILWRRIIQSDTAAENIAGLFSPISCRNTKVLVSQELSLPAQTKFSCQVEFTFLEEQNFRDLLHSALRDVGLDRRGEPVSGDWDRIDLGKLQSWLLRLRQACSHPDFGARDGRTSSVSLLPETRTLEEVLAAMLDKTTRELDIDRRLHCSYMILKGQVKEYDKEKEAALQIWLEAMVDLQHYVKDHEDTVCAMELATSASNSDLLVTDSILSERRHQNAIMDLRFWRQILHKCLFFLGSVYFQLGNGEEENKYYALAKDVRRSLLSETEAKAMHKMTGLKNAAKKKMFVTIPEMAFPNQDGGLYTRDLLERLRVLSILLNEQANQLDDWRELCIARLNAALADQNDDPSGEEYQQSLDLQEEAYAYHELIKFAVSDRNEMVSGTTNTLTSADLEKAVLLLDDGENPGTVLKDGLATRAKLVPRPDLGNLNMLKGQLRDQIRAIEAGRHSHSGGNSRILSLEHEGAKEAIRQLDHQLAAQKAAVDELNTEVEQLSSVFNARLEYYRQLQAISDDVLEYTVLKPIKPTTVGQDLDENLDRARGRKIAPELDESDISDEERKRRVKEALFKIELDTIRVKKSIDQKVTRSRYLQYLGNDQKEKFQSCTICLETFEVGAFTMCGHVFCLDCFHRWYHEHGACAICKTVLPNADCFQQISLKPFTQHTDQSDSPGMSLLRNIDLQAMYCLLDDDAKGIIKSQTLGRSYSSKIDSIVRHLISLPRGSKSILYSNWNAVTDTIGDALLRNDVCFLRLGQRNKSSATESVLSRFKHDPTVEVLLMSGESVSAGLTLVNATNLFLVEPLLSPAVEQQIVSRIHRIGQTKPTSVFQYYVSGTLEQALLQQAILRKVMEGQPQADRGSDHQMSHSVHIDEDIPTKTSEMPNREQAMMLLKANLQRLCQDDALFGREQAEANVSI